MTPTGAARQEAGLANDDGYVHVAIRAINGHRTPCGAGRITTLIPGRFDPTDRLACPRCVELLDES